MTKEEQLRTTKVVAKAGLDAIRVSYMLSIKLRSHRREFWSSDVVTINSNSLIFYFSCQARRKCIPNLRKYSSVVRQHKETSSQN